MDEPVSKNPSPTDKVIRFCLENKLVVGLLVIFFIGWGWIGHSIINFNTVLSASPEMYFFEDWPEFLSAQE